MTTEDPRNNDIENETAERGASLVEYALLLALIAVVCVVAVAYLGDTTSTSYSSTGSMLSG